MSHHLQFELFEIPWFSTVSFSRMFWWLRQSACNARDLGSVPGSGRSPGNALQYSCLENPMDRGAWQTTVHCVHKGLSLQQIALEKLDDHLQNKWHRLCPYTGHNNLLKMDHIFKCKMQDYKTRLNKITRTDIRKICSMTIELN